MARARLTWVTVAVVLIICVVWQLRGEFSQVGGGPGQIYSSSKQQQQQQQQQQPEEHNNQSDYYPTTLSSSNESLFLPQIEIAHFGDDSYKHGILRTTNTSTSPLLPARMADDNTDLQSPSVLPDPLPDPLPAQLPVSWKVTDTWVRSCVQNVTDTAEVKGFIVDAWQSYRLGDCIKLCAFCNDVGTNTSFAKAYSQKACAGEGKKNRRKGGNITVVKEILDLYQDDPAFTKPGKDEVVLHFRLGDVMEKSKSSVEEMLVQGGTPAHHANFKNSIRSVYEYLANIEESGATKVAIRGGSHFPDLYKKSRVYAGCMKRALEASGYEVTMVLDGSDPDRDFYFMSSARKFIVGIGGYSRLIGHVVRSNNGTVYGRVFR